MPSFAAEMKLKFEMKPAVNFKLSFNFKQTAKRRRQWIKLRIGFDLASWLGFFNSIFFLLRLIPLHNPWINQKEELNEKPMPLSISLLVQTDFSLHQPSTCLISTYVCFLSIDILTVIIIFAAVSNSSAQFTLTSEFKLCKKRERMIPAGAEMDFGINPFPRKKIEWMKAEWGAEAESANLINLLCPLSAN